jgi:shikimate dehydrogenase
MTIGGTTRVVALLGQPVSGSLSPRMQNAAFAARGLDWVYVALDVAPAGLREAVRGLAALGFAGANVTIPHKQGAAELCDELDELAARTGSVNTLVVRDGRILGSSTDAEALRELEPRRAAVIGGGGSALAWSGALALRGIVPRVFTRRGEWPPEVDDADLVVNATPVRDELLFEPRAGQSIVDLPYRADGTPTALAAAARAAGCTLVDGAEVLVRQGAASFERWTGVPAPVEVMRAALAGLAGH